MGKKAKPTHKEQQGNQKKKTVKPNPKSIE